MDNWELLKAEIAHLKELMAQHDKLTEIAINKAETTLNDRLAKVNEFREQQKDIIGTFARQKDTEAATQNLSERFEQNIKTVTDRYEANTKAIHDKIDMLERHTSEKIELMRQALEDKRDTLIRNLDEKFAANLKTESEKHGATDRQMKILIDANAEISNSGLQILNAWKENTQGSIKVIMAVGGFIIAIIIALIVGFIRTI